MINKGDTAWMMTSNNWRGMSSFSLSAILRPQSYALSVWQITLKASMGSPLISMSSRTRSLARYSSIS